jgi:DNA-binding transcriptional LysR family regulator
VAQFNLNSLIRRVDLLTLRLFLTIEEEGRLGRSAVRENIAPSAVTKRIQDFEDEIGVKLFYRERDGVVLTPAGRVVARHVRRIFDTLDMLRREIADFADGVRGHLRVSVTDAAIIEQVSEAIGAFSRQFPLVNVELREDTNRNVLRAAMTGAVEIAVYWATSDLTEDGVETFPFRTDRLMVLVPHDHARAGRDSLSFADIFEEDLVLPPEMLTLVGALSGVADRFDRDVSWKYRVTTKEAARSLVGAGLGLTIQPEQPSRSEAMAGIKSIPLAEEWAIRQLRIAVPRRKPLTQAAQALLDQLLAGRPGADVAPSAAALAPLLRASAGKRRQLA